MKSESYHQARSAALKELADVAKQRGLLEKRIARLKQTIASLDTLIEGDDPPSELMQELQVVGITDVVRNALKIARGPRTAIEVRDWLAISGYDLSEQENALASIHTILKRLVKAGQADVGTNAGGKATYRWIGGGDEALRAALGQTDANAVAAIRQAAVGMMPANDTVAKLSRLETQLELSSSGRRAFKSKKKKKT